ncbi:replication protein [Brevibacillus porteri]|uniref:replication protein n=1 Tax=Brevibacillus porteri TaxID=2126350 RepID=UPI003D1E7AA9
MPQIEDGYTRLANEILEHIMKASLNGTQFRIVMAVWRYTYGFQRKEHDLSLTFLAKAIDAGRGQVDREMTALIDRKIIIVVGTGGRGSRVIAFNKNHSEWTVPTMTTAGSTQGIISKEIRKEVIERDRYECRYCGSKEDLTLDHVFPKSLGGENTIQNLVTACRVCNSRKGAKTLEQSGLTLRSIG